MGGEQLIERPLLRGRRPALAQDVAADAALQAALLREGEIVPSVGEEGAAV
jgi:hypothetical protein